MRGLPEGQIIEDIKATAAAVVDPAVEAPLFRDGTEDLVSRYKLNMALTNIILRYHDGLPISRKRLVDDKVVDQRYWQLAYRVLTMLGIVGGATMAYKSRGDEQLDWSSSAGAGACRWGRRCGCCLRQGGLGAGGSLCLLLLAEARDRQRPG